MAENPHLTSFGSILALPDLDQTASLLAPSAQGIVPPPASFSSQPFSRMEEQSLMLGASLFGPRWLDIAQLIGSRTVSGTKSFTNEPDGLPCGIASQFLFDNPFPLGSLTRPRTANLAGQSWSQATPASASCFPFQMRLFSTCGRA